jgi:NAD(P)-dependent dehydrogenase (short-subunit alcohol dehydrogenase family)
MVTGATSGIGEVTARVLAEKGVVVIVVSRNPDKCKCVTEDIKQKSDNPEVDYLVADLSSQVEIRKLVKDFEDRYQHLDILVNNAGSFFFNRQESVDGIEMTLALNHLNYFLLTNLLLERIKASTPARIVNVASGSHLGARIDFDDLEMRRNYSGLRAYGRSKLANVLFTYELARRLEGSGVTANTLTPGFVATHIGLDNNWLVRTVKTLANLFAKTPEEGAQTSIYLASSPEVEGVSGKYFVDCKPVPSDAVTYDQTLAKRLWEVSAEMTGLKED